MTRWTQDDLADQTGKTILVTGANSGLGLEAALAMARKGAHVIGTCRSMERGQGALAKIRAAVADADVVFDELDVADLASVRGFAARRLADQQHIDVLINNAGIMAVPERRTTVDGFELQLGTNHLGPFALTASCAGRVARALRGDVIRGRERQPLRSRRARAGAGIPNTDPPRAAWHRRHCRKQAVGSHRGTDRRTVRPCDALTPPKSLRGTVNRKGPPSSRYCSRARRYKRRRASWTPATDPTRGAQQLKGTTSVAQLIDVTNTGNLSQTLKPVAIT